MDDLSRMLLALGPILDFIRWLFDRKRDSERAQIESRRLKTAVFALSLTLIVFLLIATTRKTEGLVVC